MRLAMCSSQCDPHNVHIGSVTLTDKGAILSLTEHNVGDTISLVGRQEAYIRPVVVEHAW